MFWLEMQDNLATFPRESDPSATPTAQRSVYRSLSMWELADLE
jgi:hypothetical protein